MCRSPAWGSPAWGSPPIPGEILPNQVKDGGKDHIDKWFSHLTLSSFAVLSLFSSDELSLWPYSRLEC
jgi:hypothetical protein